MEKEKHTLEDLKKEETTENEKYPLDELNNDQINKIMKKTEMHTEGPVIWREN